MSGIEYFEEDANLPPDQTPRHTEVDEASMALSIAKISTHNSDTEREAAPASKKSLFKDTTNSEEPKTNHTDGGRNLRVNLESAAMPHNENASAKRRAMRFAASVECAEPKRAKRVSENFSDSKNTPSNPKDKCEEEKKRGRGRPRKSGNLVEAQGASLVENESQNLFVSTPVQLKKSSVANSPFDSLMNAKNSEESAKMRRKSLTVKRNELPARSPVATRKRKSSLFQIFNQKKPCSIIDEPSSKKAGPSSSTIEVDPVVVDVDDVANNNTDSSSKIVSNAEKRCNDVDVEDEEESEMNSSVVIIEPPSANEIISIIDTESQSVPEKTDETKTVNPPVVPLFDDESTFFEDVEVSRKPENVCQTTKKGPNGKAAESSESGESRKSIANESFPDKLILEETQAGNCLQKSDQVVDNAAEVNVNSNAARQSNNPNSPNKSAGSPTKIVSSPTKNKNNMSNKTTLEKKEGVSRKESPSPTKSNEKAATPSDLDMSSVKKRLIDEGETQNANVDQQKVNTSPLTNNTRTFKIMRMACDSQNFSKHKHFGKISKSPLSSSPSPSNSRITSTNQRTMKILMANNGSAEKPRLSPTKVLVYFFSHFRKIFKYNNFIH